MRLTKISTKTGDDGSTGLADGKRLGKEHARITSLGSVDELNSHIGVILAEKLPPEIRTSLVKIQNDLFDLGGTLAQPEKEVFAKAKVAWLDEQVERNNADMPPLREFILPGGLRAGAQCHLARTVARRAERDLVQLSRDSRIPKQAIPYLNRLSDLLFVFARQINLQDGVAESFWQSEG